MLTGLDLNQLNATFEGAPPEEILRWAVETFWPDIAMSSSFQTQSLPLLHMVSQVVPQLPVIFLDTGFHFPETLSFRDQVVRELGLTLRIVRPSLSPAELAHRYGEGLYRRDPDLCCYVNKVEPMQRALEGLQAWISGIRRDQSPARAHIRIVERTAQGIIRVHPMATWTERDIARYIHDHNLPEHPLFAQGYLSVGCAPCTRPVYGGEPARAGRWDGQAKLECGLHTLLREPVKAEVPAEGEAGTGGDEGL
ncbi:MAG: phosphoadenylyl-sulfate reductase [Chloroflexi bacterium]|nr:MAG: phosphoadenylyl-sulfate reductase [Chloroflexota bacterium]